MFYITLAACRVNAGLSMQELAKILNVSKNTIWNWENGITRPGFEYVKKISEISKIPMEHIFESGCDFGKIRD